MAAVVRLQPCLPRNGCRVCIAAITLEDVAALQLAQPSLGKMAVKEPAQPFYLERWYIPRLASPMLLSGSYRVSLSAVQSQYSHACMRQ